MPGFRVVVRHGGTRPRYEVMDVEAASLSDALRDVADRIPPELDATADLVEVRRQATEEDRERDTVPG